MSMDNVIFGCGLTQRYDTLNHPSQKELVKLLTRSTLKVNGKKPLGPTQYAFQLR